VAPLCNAKNYVKVVTEIVDFTSETVIAMTIKQYLCPILIKSQLETLAEILEGIFQTVSYFNRYICV
jgi:dsRNA-specific ribonuclease